MYLWYFEARNIPIDFVIDDNGQRNARNNQLINCIAKAGASKTATKPAPKERLFCGVVTHDAAELGQQRHQNFNTALG